MKKFCTCGQKATAQGYCARCLKDLEFRLALDIQREQFEEFHRFATEPPTKEEIFVEEAHREALAIDQQNIESH